MRNRQWVALRIGIPSLVLGVVASCGEPLVDPQLVEAPRVYGARLEAVEDPARAQLAAGEDGILSFLIAVNQPAVATGLIHVCKASGSTVGAPECDGEVLEVLQLAGPVSRPLTAQFILPGSLKAGAEWLAWSGFCLSGEPRALSNELFECSDGSEALHAFAQFLTLEASANQNPSLADDTLKWNKGTWPESELLPVGSACKESELLQANIGEAAVVHFRQRGDDREALRADATSYAQAQRESLLYSHAASHAGLERAFSAIDHDSTKTSFTLEFAAPKNDHSRNGETVNFYLVVRDGRGGADWLTRQFCLLP